jgi:hypothetical protein
MCRLEHLRQRPAHHHLAAEHVGALDVEGAKPPSRRAPPRSDDAASVESPSPISAGCLGSCLRVWSASSAFPAKATTSVLLTMTDFNPAYG